MATIPRESYMGKGKLYVNDVFIGNVHNVEIKPTNPNDITDLCKIVTEDEIKDSDISEFLELVPPGFTYIDHIGIS